MPNHIYHYSNCGFTEEIKQRISEAPLTTCPNCGKETFQRAITGGAGVIYKGEGWYVTDYSKKSSGGKEPETKSASETKEKKSEKSPAASTPETPQKKTTPTEKNS